MKKLAFIGILIAGSLFAGSISDSSNTQLNSMVAGADAKTLSEISFEIHKRASKLSSQEADIIDEFREQMRSKISAMSPDERAEFMQEYRGIMRDKMDSLSVKEAGKMRFYAHNGGQNSGHGRHDKFGRGHNNSKFGRHYNCGEFGFECGNQGYMRQARGSGFGCMWQ